MCPTKLDECYLAEVQMACCDEEGTNCVVRHIYSAVLDYDSLNMGNYNYAQACRTDNRFHKPVLWCALGYMYLTDCETDCSDSTPTAGMCSRLPVRHKLLRLFSLST